MLSRARTTGFTLVELMVTLAVLAIVLAAAMPSFSGMMQNSRIGNAARGYQVGLQTARTEAIRRNVPVDFVLTDTPVGAGIESSAVAAASGKNWVVRIATPAAASVPAGFVHIESKSAQESGGGNLEVQGVATAPPSATFGGIVTFNGFGSTSAGETIELSVNGPAGTTCAAQSGPLRCQRIQVRPGGQITLCDPAAPTGDSRACPT